MKSRTEGVKYSENVQKMQVDYAVLKKRIQALVKRRPQAQPPVTDGEFRHIKEFVRPLIESEFVRSEILKKGMTILDGCQDCLQHAALRKARIVGAGFNGTVFDVGQGRAVKVELVHPDYLNGPVHAGEVAQLMGTLGVGPKVRSWRLCGCQFATYLVIEMALVIGRPLRDWSREGHRDATVAKVQDALRKKVLKMHEAGYLHGDLNPENVVIDGNNVPWIIDFSYMQTIGRGHARKNNSAAEMNLRIVDFLGKGPPAPHMEEADHVVSKVFDALVHEGTLTAVNGRFIDTKFSAFGQM